MGGKGVNFNQDSNKIEKRLLKFEDNWESPTQRNIKIGVLPYIGHTEVCTAPKGMRMVFAPFWSEHGIESAWSRGRFSMKLRELINVSIFSVPNE